MLLNPRPLNAYKQTSFNSASRGTFMVNASGAYLKVTLGQGIPVILPLEGEGAFKEIPRQLLQERTHESLQQWGDQPCIEVPIDELRVTIRSMSAKPLPTPWHSGVLGLTQDNKFVVCIEASIGNKPSGYLIELPSGDLRDTGTWGAGDWNTVSWINHWSLESIDRETGACQMLFTFDGRNLPYA